MKFTYIIPIQKREMSISNHLKKYLDYYKKTKNPGYAVLITGEWGTGKTFQVKQVLKKEKHYYVSLYGLHSAADIHDLVLAEVHPISALSKSFVKGLDETSKNVGSLAALGSPLAGLMKARLRKNLKPRGILIFDDLERCELDLKETLGIINTYVEQQGFQVIIIAHDEKIDKDADKEENLNSNSFKKTKEKLIGQTIKVEPQTEQAFDVFHKNIPNSEANKFIKNYKKLIISTFSQSGEKSLRILRHVIEDLARLYDCLDKTHLKNKEAMEELVGLFSALNIEFRAGYHKEEDTKLQREKRLLDQNLNDEDYKKESNKIKKWFKKKSDNIDRINDKYQNLDLKPSLSQDSPIINLLQNNVVISMFVKGLYDKEAIRKSLSDNHYFLKPEEAPPWKTVISFNELEDNIVDAAIKKMNQQFENREITNVGEMLHIFALRMLMADTGELKTTVSDEVNAAKKYIDDLLKNNKLPPKVNDSEIWLTNGYDGIGFWYSVNNEDNKKQFQKIKDYLQTKREKALENSLPEKAKELLELLKTDTRAFYEQVSVTNNSPYSNTPILKYIPAEDFVEICLNSNKDDFKLINDAMENRHGRGLTIHALDSEKDWLNEVRNLINKEADKETGLKGLRIKRLFPNTSW